MDMHEEKVELALELIVEEEDDDDDGPPPGFQCIIAPQPPENAEAEAEADDDGDGPPPGFHSIAAKPTQSLPSSDTEWSSKQDNIDDDDEDGPPPGWGFNTLADALPKETSSTADVLDIKEDSNEELDDGPPPGWESMLPCQMPPPCTPPLQPPPTVSSSTDIGKKTAINDNEVPPSEPQGTPMPGHSSPGAQPLQLLPSSELPSDAGNKNRSKIGTEKPTPGYKHVSSRQQIPPNPHPLRQPATSSSSEKCQLVCGTCRKLCVYPRGAKWVQCPGCKEVNFVLEAHEVGQVKCGGCSVLLMYPHGAPAVQCSSCRFVTEIGAHNRRPPLSVQQARAQRRRRSTNRAR